MEYEKVDTALFATRFCTSHAPRLSFRCYFFRAHAISCGLCLGEELQRVQYLLPFRNIYEYIIPDVKNKQKSTHKIFYVNFRKKIKVYLKKKHYLFTW